MSGDHNQYQKGSNHSWKYVGSKRQVLWQCGKCDMLTIDNPNPEKEKPMLDPTKLQYYTMASRMRGFAEGIIDQHRHEALINMLNKAASLLEHAWDEYQSTLPPEQQIGS